MAGDALIRLRLDADQAKRELAAFRSQLARINQVGGGASRGIAAVAQGSVSGAAAVGLGAAGVAGGGVALAALAKAVEVAGPVLERLASSAIPELVNAFKTFSDASVATERTKALLEDGAAVGVNFTDDFIKQIRDREEIAENRRSALRTRVDGIASEGDRNFLDRFFGGLHR